MAQINPRVIARIDLMRAQAADGLAKLEAAQRSSTTIGSGSGQQIARMRAIKELRDQVESWDWVLSVAMTVSQVVLAEPAEDDVDAEKEFPA